MIVMRTVGGDLCKAELQVGLVLKTDDSPTPEALGGYGNRLFAIVAASDREREMLRQHGIELEDVDLRWAELHHRQPVKNRRRLEVLSRAGKKARARAKSRAMKLTTTLTEAAEVQTEMRHAA